MLGDEVTFTGSPIVIPDGARYSKNLRDSYLYRAMLEVLTSRVNSTASLDRDMRNNVLSEMFPTFMVSDSLAWLTAALQTRNLSRTPVYIYTVSTRPTGAQRAVVFSHCTPQKFRALINRRHIVDPDPIWRHRATTLEMYMNETDRVYAGNALSSPDIVVDYIPIPLDPNGQQSDDTIDFEEAYMSEVIRMAADFGRMDSQEFQSNG